MHCIEAEGTACVRHACSVGRLVQELAPQDVKGGYQRPSYTFGSGIGDPKFPAEQGRCDLKNLINVPQLAYTTQF